MAKATRTAKRTRFSTFLCRRFAGLQRETSRNISVTRFRKEMSHVFLPLVFILVAASFLPAL